MPPHHTIQTSFEALRTAVTAADTALDGATADRTYRWLDKPTVARAIGPEANAIIIHFTGTGNENDAFSWKLYLYSDEGPATFVAAGTATLGTAVYSGSTYYADTIEITDASLWFKMPVSKDNGNDRVSHLAFFVCGYKWVYLELSDIAGANQPSSVNAYVKYF